jgi:hypothetical protein
VDADSSETVQPLAGEISLQLMFLDEKGKRITEEVVNLEELSQPLPNPFHIRPIVKNHNEIWQSMYYDWFMYSVFSTKIPIDPGFSRRGMIFPTETEDRITSLCIAPLIIHVDFTINRQIVHSPRCNFQLHLKHKVNLADSQLEAIKQIKVGVELLNKPKTKP